MWLANRNLLLNILLDEAWYRKIEADWSLCRWWYVRQSYTLPTQHSITQPFHQASYPAVRRGWVTISRHTATRSHAIRSHSSTRVTLPFVKIRRMCNERVSVIGGLRNGGKIVKVVLHSIRYKIKRSFFLSPLFKRFYVHILHCQKYRQCPNVVNI